MIHIEFFESESALTLQALDQLLVSKRAAYLQAVRGIAEPRFQPEDFGIKAIMELIQKIESADNLDEQPLHRLCRLIEQGAEYPDAVYQVSREYRLNDEEFRGLEDDYLLFELKQKQEV